MSDAEPHLLVVDDDARLRELLRRYLSDNGLRVTLAADAREARASLASFAFDLIVLDVMMPQTSGYEVCQAIRSRPDWRHIKVVMLSAKGRDAEVNKGMAMGADLYVTKPFSTRDLMAKIEALLAGGAG